MNLESYKCDICKKEYYSLTALLYHIVYAGDKKHNIYKRWAWEAMIKITLLEGQLRDSHDVICLRERQKHKKDGEK